MNLLDGRELGPFAFTCLAFASSVLAGVAALLLRPLAARLGLVSRHRRDRFGVGDVPLVGGPALAVGILAPLAALGLPLSPGQAVALGGFFLVGLADDRLHLRPAPKFALQGVVALAAGALLLPPAYAAFAAVILLFLVNACNYLDNMDGLLAGVGLTQAVTLLLWGIVPTTGAPLLVWALPALLFLSLPPARIYLGDSGSHLVGALLGIDVIAYLFGGHGIVSHLLGAAVVLFLVQILDVGTVTVSRLSRGRPVFRGGTDHLSHRLVRRGYAPPWAVLVLVLASGVCGVASLFLVYSS